MQTVKKEYVEKRLNDLRKRMSENGIDFLIIWDPDNQYYLSGFRAISYSRPIILLVYPDKTQYIIPALEEDHARENAKVDDFFVYHEKYSNSYLDTTFHQPLERIIDKLAKDKVLGLELNTVPASLYKELQINGFNIKDISHELIEMRAIKDEEEIYWLDQAGFLSDIALDASFANLKVGMSELEFDSNGDRKLLEIASKKYPDNIVGYENWTCSGIKRSTMPHLYSSTRKFEKNDVVIHSRQVWINGYRAENERTFLIGKPHEEQKKCLQLAIEAQRIGMEAVKPGVKAKDVDIASFNAIKNAGYADFVQHRIGHGLGLTEHEEPYLRFDNEIVLKEGMVYTIEPGIYIPSVGGFRHSDTVIVTKDGCRSITKYPRELIDLLFDI
ncbi:cobalt dependent X-Pro dipeptidase [Candidatus Syntrophocurvum alkaliphilum]|uniref:Cobalt dependent X-Pro dipeptidase n=1 Tax=Candidatus Syntrophocurvum alkaliphilum TaxID=2293317 RepID=A0A6I6DFK6_9FIRM|nr:Xaa-Pro peptidase family protein [Candidatus Syntrophocurvum alkaliphilum]QGT99732.1 cobalt dependent X-Pro dipeptidase [Candidatus Syntrophocurvum alkaliphilum]